MLPLIPIFGALAVGGAIAGAVTRYISNEDLKWEQQKLRAREIENAELSKKAEKNKEEAEEAKMAAAKARFEAEEAKDAAEEAKKAAIELDNKIQIFKQNLKNTEHYFQFVLGTMAFGVAIARVDDGKIDEDEKQELEEFLLGETAKGLPSHIKEQMHKIYEDSEMNLSKALGFLPNINKEGREIIGNLLYIVAYSNNDMTEEQKDFIINYRIEEAKIKYMGE